MGLTIMEYVITADSNHLAGAWCETKMIVNSNGLDWIFPPFPTKHPESHEGFSSDPVVVIS